MNASKPFRARARSDQQRRSTHAMPTGPQRQFLGGVRQALGNVGNTVKKAVVDTGHTVGKVADNKWVQAATAAALAATGVGAPAAAAIMAGMAGGGKILAPGGNIGEAIGAGAKGAAMGYGASKLGAALKGGGSLLGKGQAALGAAKSLGGSSGLSGLGSAATGYLGNALTGGGSGGTGGVNPLLLALAAGQTANAANLGKTANDFSDKAWSSANDSYAERAGLRSQGIGRMLTPSAPNTSGLAAIRGANPFARLGGAPAPTPAPDAPPPSIALGVR